MTDALTKQVEITLEGQCITAVSVSNKATWKARAKARGVAHTASVTQKTTLLISGPGFNTKVDAARARGITVITEEQARELFDQGRLMIEAPVDGEEGIDGLLGEVRSALDGEPNADTWNTLIGLIDRCTPEQKPVLVDYIQPHISQWARSREQCWVPKDERSPPRKWVKSVLPGDLRVTPHHWIARAQSPEPMPELGLVRVLHLTDLRLKSTVALKLLKRPELCNLHTLDLGVGNWTQPYTKSLYTKLHTITSWEKLEVFGPGRYDKKLFEFLSHVTQWQFEGTVMMNMAFHQHELYDLLSLDLDCFQHARGLILGLQPEPVTDALVQRGDLLPGLTHLWAREEKALWAIDRTPRGKALTLDHLHATDY